MAKVYRVQKINYQTLHEQSILIDWLLTNFASTGQLDQIFTSLHFFPPSRIYILQVGTIISRITAQI